MAEHEQPQGWVCCLQLLVMPWRLPQHAFTVSAVTACLLGSLSIWWIVFSFTALFFLLVNEPWAYWNDVFHEFLGVGIIAALFASIFAALFIVAFMPVNAMSHNRTRPSVIALSFLCMIPIYTLWIISVAIVELSGDVMVSKTLLNDLADLKVFQVTSSCMWLPVLVIGWLLATITSIRIVEERAKRVYGSLCSCGYDLRGSIAGGSTKCPECGVDIPERMLADPPSIAADA